MERQILNENNEELLSEIKKLKAENKRLSRELKTFSRVWKKAAREIEEKDTRKTLENMLDSSGDFQRYYIETLLEYCPDIMILFDSGGKLVLCTQALLKEIGVTNYGYIKDSHFRDIFSDILNSDACEKLVRAIGEAIKTQETVTLNEYMDFGNKGFPRHYIIELNAFSSHTIVVFHDQTDYITEKERADIASRAKSDFLATISHEIRTPVNAIMGMAEILSRTSVDIKQKEHLNNIKNSSSALITIINDILDFSQMETGELNIENGYYSLRELLEGLYAAFAPMFKAKNLELYYSVSKTIPETVYGDEKRLRQVFTNILSNGLKYTFEGHVEFFAWMSEEDNILHIAIHDTGVGIRPKDIKKLFTPFEQLGIRKKETIVGTGLGLAISRRLCEMMNGTMGVESTYGAGSTFSVDIPCLTGEETEKSVEPAELLEFSAKDAKVLVVDDIEINLAVTEAMLQIFDITPDLTLRGSEAVELVAKKKYDIIFMDQMMPEIDGIETTRLIRSLGDEYRDIPIVALTANVINDAEKMFLENGFNGFLPKPLEIDALNLCLRKFLPKGMIREYDMF